MGCATARAGQQPETTLRADLRHDLQFSQGTVRGQRCWLRGPAQTGPIGGAFAGGVEPDFTKSTNARNGAGS
jgi:hypothetical protein